jgi:VanZ family protein
MDKVWFDKWVHVGIFMTLISSWSWALNFKDLSAYGTLIIIALIYGLSIEIIQDRFIPNRSFDLGDLLADFIGCLVGVWLRMRIIKRYIKNKPL